MMHSVRLRLICRRQGFLHELMQLIAKHLRKPDAQPEPSADAGFGRSTLAVYHSKDPRLPYEPENCRWATWAEQGVNRREHHMTPLERAALRRQRSALVRGELSPMAKLKDAQVAVIKRRIAEGARTSDLARQFGVAPQTISGIKRGDKWKHVQPELARAA